MRKRTVFISFVSVLMLISCWASFICCFSMEEGWVCRCFISSGGMPSSAQSVSRVMVGKNGWLFYVTEYNNLNPNPQIIEVIERISKINKLLDKKNVKLYVAVVPIKVRIYSDMLPDTFWLSNNIRNQYNFILENFKKEGIKYVDLNSVFMTDPSRLDDVPLWWKTDTHWSTLGVLKGAEAISRKIRKSGVTNDLPALTSTLSIQEKGAYLSSDGDLYNMLSEKDKANYKNVFTVKNVQINNSTSSDLLSDDVPRVALVGTSYASKFEGLLAKAVAYYLKRDVLNISTPSVAYFLPMYNYIKSIGFRDNLPKILVWEIPERQLTGNEESHIKLTDPKYLELLKTLQ